MIKTTNKEEYTVDGFAEIFTGLNKKHETSAVFLDFLDYCIDQYIQSDIEYFGSKNKYSNIELEVFDELYDYWLCLSKQEIKANQWYDFFGTFYEEYILAKFKAGDKGQFFTPHAISDLLTNLTSPISTDKESLSAYDGACGSARNLLSYHSKYPQTILYGEDLDESACKMAVLNFIVHNVTGYVCWVNSLTREWFGGWSIKNGKITLLTDDPFKVEVNSKIDEQVQLI